jgi:hypothetical protein
VAARVSRVLKEPHRQRQEYRQQRPKAAQQLPRPAAEMLVVPQLFDVPLLRKSRIFRVLPPKGNKQDVKKTIAARGSQASVFCRTVLALKVRKRPLPMLLLLLRPKRTCGGKEGVLLL